MSRGKEGAVVIFTDGACSGNPGPGGWGALLRYKGVEKELSGGEPETTNNRMEMMAAIAGLEALTRPAQVEIWTDSTYLKDGITRWLPAWKARVQVSLRKRRITIFSALLNNVTIRNRTRTVQMLFQI